MRYKNIALSGGAFVAVIVVIVVVRFWMPDEPIEQISEMSGENQDSEVLPACFLTRPKIIDISLSLTGKGCRKGLRDQTVGGIAEVIGVSFQPLPHGVNRLFHHHEK